jgi:hypothetical protein
MFRRLDARILLRIVPTARASPAWVTPLPRAVFESIICQVRVARVFLLFLAVKFPHTRKGLAMLLSQANPANFPGETI